MYAERPAKRRCDELHGLQRLGTHLAPCTAVNRRKETQVCGRITYVLGEEGEACHVAGACVLAVPVSPTVTRRKDDAASADPPGLRVQELQRIKQRRHARHKHCLRWRWCEAKERGQIEGRAVLGLHRSRAAGGQKH